MTSVATMGSVPIRYSTEQCEKEGVVQGSAFGEDAYPTLIEKAAALLHSLVLNHPFVDGNKRTATISLVESLDENGWRVIWQPAEALEFIIAIAEGSTMFRPSLVG